MPFTVPCPTCKSDLNVPEDLDGQVIQCPQCGAPLVAKDLAAARRQRAAKRKLSSRRPVPEYATSSTAVQSLGIASLVLAVVGFAICWIPLLNLLAAPVSGLGFVLGIIGLVLSSRRQGRAIGYSVAGSSVSLLSLVVVGGMYFWLAHLRAQQDATNQDLVALEAPSSRPVRATTKWADARKYAVQQADLRVQINDLRLEHGAGLYIKLAVTNVSSARRILYRSWGATEPARLTDDLGNGYRLRPGSGITPETINPGYAVDDLLMFETPLPNARCLYLELPATVFGGSGQLRLEINRTMMVLRLARALGAPVVPELCQLLKHEETTVRREATTVLGGFGPLAASAVAPLAEVLQDPEAAVRVAACQALGKLGPLAHESFGALLAALGDGRDEVHQAALRALAELGPATRADVPVLQAALRDPKLVIRRYAVTTLARLDLEPATATPIFLEALRDESADIRAIAAGMLEQHDPKLRTAVLAALVNALEDPDQSVRQTARQSVRRLPPAAADLPLLSATLNGKTVEARLYAAFALEQLGPTAGPTVPVLLEFVNDPEIEVRTGVIRALGAIGPGAEKAVPLLVARLGDAEGGPRAAATTALGRIGPAALPALQTALEQGNDLVRSQAASAFEEANELARAAIPALMKALKDPSAPVRVHVATALGNLGADSRVSLAALGPALRNSERAVRRAAAQAVANIGPGQDLLGPLLELFKENDPEVHAAASDALTKISSVSKSAVPTLRTALAGTKPAVRAFAAGMLAKLGSDAADALPELQQALQDRNAQVSRNAARALVGLGPVEGRLPALLDGLQSADPEVVQITAAALAHEGRFKKADVPALIAALASPKADVRLFAAEALEKIGPDAKRAGPELQRLLEDPDERVRRQATAALGKIGRNAVSSVKALAASLHDKNPTVRKNAAAALGELGPDARPAVADLMKSLKDAAIKEDAAAALVKIGRGAVADLLEVLDGTDYDLRLTVLDILGRMGPEAQDAVATLATIAKTHKFPSIREAARKALARIQEK